MTASNAAPYRARITQDRNRLAARSQFFSHQGKQLLGVYHPPKGPANGRGLVFCNAFGGEYVVFRSFFTGFAQLMSARGYGLFRFDYTGYGDSEGEFADADIHSMTSDIDRAIDEFAAKAELDEVGLVGARFGGLLATLVAARRKDVQRLILWEPVLSAWTFLYTALRATVAMQTMMFRDVHFTRDQIIENVLAGKKSLHDGYDLNCIDDGFPLGANLLRQAKEIDLVKDTPDVSTETLLLNIRKKAGTAPKKLSKFADALRAKGASCQLDVAVEKALPWKHDNFYATRCPDVYERTRAWLDAP